MKDKLKGKLGSSYVKPITQKLTGDALDKYFEENPQQAKAIMEKSLMAAWREAAKKARDLTRKKDSMSVGTLPGKLLNVKVKILQLENYIWWRGFCWRFSKTRKR